MNTGRPGEKMGAIAAQKAAQILVDSGFKVIVFGEKDSPEVRGVLEWTYGNGVAILNPEEDVTIPRRKVALLAQPTGSEASFAEFVARFIAHNINRINEVRIINTIHSEAEGPCAATPRAADGRTAVAGGGAGTQPGEGESGEGLRQPAGGLPSRSGLRDEGTAERAAGLDRAGSEQSA